MGSCSIRWWRPAPAARLVGALVLAGTLAAAGGAQAAELAARATPVGFLGSATVACPTTAENARTGAAAGLASVVTSADPVTGKRDDMRRFFASLVIRGTLEEPTPIAVLCDPALAKARTPIGPLSGAVAQPRLADVVGPGLRALTAGPAGPDRPLAIGDHLTLPSVGAGATLDLSVGTTTGAGFVRLGPFSSPPVAATIAGTVAAPTVRVELAGAQTKDVRVPVPTAVAASVGVAGGDAGLRVTVRGTPGALVTVDGLQKEADDSGISALGYDALGTVGASGRLVLTTGAFGARSHKATISVVDLPTHRNTTVACALRWRHARLASARCKPTAATPLSATPARHHERRMVPSHTLALRASAPTAHASRATAAPLADATLTAIERYPANDVRYRGDDIELADLTGDGLPEVFQDGLGSPRQILVSKPTEWLPAQLGSGSLSDVSLRPVPDLTGDGIDDLYLGDGQIIAGDPAWSQGAGAPSIDVHPTSPGPHDLVAETALPDTDLDFGWSDTPPTALPDSTGDGRPELLDQTGAIYASQSVPLGARTAFPVVRDAAPDAPMTVYRDVVRQATTNDDTPAAATSHGPMTSVVTGAAPITTEATVSERGKPRSVITIDRHPTAAPWAFAPTAKLVLPSRADVTDVDVARGELLVVSTAERCVRGKGCVVSVRRVGASGAVLATAAVRTQAITLDAKFIADGPDIDDRPEVVVRTADPEEDLRLPSFGDAIQVWPSAQPAADLAALPALAVDGQAVHTIGPLLSWRLAGKPASLVTFERPAADEDPRLLLLSLAP